MPGKDWGRMKMCLDYGKFKELSFEEMVEVDGGLILTGMARSTTVRSIASGACEVIKWPYETIVGYYEIGKDTVIYECK